MSNRVNTTVVTFMYSDIMSSETAFFFETFTTFFTVEPALAWPFNCFPHSPDEHWLYVPRISFELFSTFFTVELQGTHKVALADLGGSLNS